MKNTFEELQSSWQNSRQNIKTSPGTIDELLATANQRQRSNNYFYYGNIAILSLTVLFLLFVWQRWMPFQDMLSRIGIGIMIGGLVIRIILEIISAVQSKKIRFSDAVVISNRETIRYFQLRKTIHGPVTIAILVSYVIGLFMLLPELNKYLATWLLAIFVSAFLVSGLFIIYKVRINIRRELDNLRFFTDLARKLNDEH